jgi:alpha,alpha-trehalose phosphorylase
MLTVQERYMDDFWRRDDVRVRGIRVERVRRTTAEIQQAIRFDPFQILQTSARAEYIGHMPKRSTLFAITCFRTMD